MESKLQNRAIEAAALLIERKGYEILDREPDAGYVDLVAADGKALVFAHVTAADSSAGFPDESPDREAAEAGAVSWLASHGGELSDIPVRFDEIAFSLVGENRALVHHHIDALGRTAS